ncbi:MAG: S4 domain-containing protein, partial [Thermomicrobiales bacterium]
MCRSRRSDRVSAPDSASARSSSAHGRARLDEALVSRGVAETRSRARALILAGDVLVNGQAVTR